MAGVYGVLALSESFGQTTQHERLDKAKGCRKVGEVAAKVDGRRDELESGRVDDFFADDGFVKEDRLVFVKVPVKVLPVGYFA